MKQIKKSRSNSAFFIFRALLFGLAGGILFWGLECVLILFKPQAFSLMDLFPSWLLPSIGVLVGISFAMPRRILLSLAGLYSILVLAAALLMVPGGLLEQKVNQYVLQAKSSWQRDQQEIEPLYTASFLMETDPLPIWYVDDGNGSTLLSEESAAWLLEFIGGLPEWLTRWPSALYFMEEAPFVSCSSEYEDSSVAGFSESQTFSLAIRLASEDAESYYTQMDDGRILLLSDPAYYSETIVHEMFHILDMILMDEHGLYSQNETLLSLYEADPNCLSEYAASSLAEFFAEAGVFYLLYPDLLQQRAPDLYSFMEQTARLAQSR